MKEITNLKNKKQHNKKHRQLPYTKQLTKMQHPNFSEYSLDFLSTISILSGIKPVLDLIEKEPQKIGLSQFKDAPIIEKSEPSIKNKNVKLSDLMRRAS